MKLADAFNFEGAHLAAGFRHFDLGLNPENLQDLERIIVRNVASYDNFGDLDAIEQDVSRFLEALGNPSHKSFTSACTITSLVKKIIAASTQETAWVTIRATQPTDMFDTPRWHMDGYFYPPYAGDQMKAVLTVKGNRTLLNIVSENVRKEFIGLQKMNLDEATRQKERNALVDASKTETTPPGYGTIFIVGSKNAAVHSEPPLSSERIFISVLPGSVEQIEYLQKNWGIRNKTEITGLQAQKMILVP